MTFQNARRLRTTIHHFADFNVGNCELVRFCLAYGHSRAALPLRK